MKHPCLFQGFVPVSWSLLYSDSTTRKLGLEVGIPLQNQVYETLALILCEGIVRNRCLKCFDSIKSIFVKVCRWHNIIFVTKRTKLKPCIFVKKKTTKNFISDRRDTSSFPSTAVVHRPTSVYFGPVPLLNPSVCQGWVNQGHLYSRFLDGLG